MTDQALLIADQHHLSEQILNLFNMAADKARDRRKMRYAVARQRLEDHVRLATPLNLSATRNAFGVRE